MTDTPALTELSPDPHAVEDAQAFAALMPPAFHIQHRLEDLAACFRHFYTMHAAPGLPEGLSEAVGVFSFAASGLFGFLALPSLDPWACLATARLWAVRKCADAYAPLNDADRAALSQAMTAPGLLPAWAEDARHAGRLREAATAAAWHLVARLLESAPTLEDGEAEDLAAAFLTALTSSLRRATSQA